jgi:hypothetical protein
MPTRTRTGIVLTAAALAFGLSVSRPLDSGTTTFAAVAQSSAQQKESTQQKEQKQPPKEQHQMPASKPSADMTKMHQQMTTDMKSEQTKLDSLVQKMNTAKGDAKVDAVAETVAELVKSHKAMMDRMQLMHAAMVQGEK